MSLPSHVCASWSPRCNRLCLRPAGYLGDHENDGFAWENTAAPDPPQEATPAPVIGIDPAVDGMRATHPDAPGKSLLIGPCCRRQAEHPGRGEHSLGCGLRIGNLKWREGEIHGEDEEAGIAYRRDLHAPVAICATNPDERADLLCEDAS